MIKEKAHYDDLTDTLHIQRSEDVTSVIEQNKRAFNDAERGYKSESFNHVARIPLSVLEMWCKNKGVKFQEAMSNERVMKLFINDPDNAHFRTRPGKI